MRYFDNSLIWSLIQSSLWWRATIKQIFIQHYTVKCLTFKSQSSLLRTLFQRLHHCNICVIFWSEIPVSHMAAGFILITKWDGCSSLTYTIHTEDLFSGKEIIYYFYSSVVCRFMSLHTCVIKISPLRHYYATAVRCEEQIAICYLCINSILSFPQSSVTARQSKLSN